LPQMMIDVFVLRLTPLFAGERAKERVDIAVETFGSKAVKSGDQLPKPLAGRFFVNAIARGRSPVWIVAST
jgi:hypothetical protein